MEDIRKLLNDEEAEIAPDSLAYTVRGLTWALVDELRDGIPADPAKKRRHLEIVGALTRSAELYATALVTWIGPHMDKCPLEK